MIKLIKKLIRKIQDKKRNQIAKIAYLIQDFYLDKNKHLGSVEMFKKATEEIVSLGITQLRVNGNKITIILRRPGLLIGRHGENIDKLDMFLSQKLKTNIILSIEDDALLDYLIPVMPDNFDID